MIIILYRAVVVRCSGLVPLVTLGICRSYSMSFVLPVCFCNINWVVSARRYAVLSRYCIGFYNRCDTFCKVTDADRTCDVLVTTAVIANLEVPNVGIICVSIRPVSAPCLTNRNDLAIDVCCHTIHKILCVRVSAWCFGLAV